jgi:hypothetical protein
MRVFDKEEDAVVRMVVTLPGGLFLPPLEVLDLYRYVVDRYLCTREFLSSNEKKGSYTIV